MSASNWAVCPRCVHVWKLALAEKARQAFEGYGILPREVFDALRAEVDAGIDLKACRTFREDYEIYGANTGELTVSYGGGCDTCGLSYSFTHKETFWAPELTEES